VAPMTPTARRSSGVVLSIGTTESLRIPVALGAVRKISYRYPNPMIETKNRKAYSILRAFPRVIPSINSTSRTERKVP